jgi:hypothetical protein
MTGKNILFSYKQMLLQEERYAALIVKKALLVLGRLPQSTIEE